MIMQLVSDKDDKESSRQTFLFTFSIQSGCCLVTMITMRSKSTQFKLLPPGGSCKQSCLVNIVDLAVGTMQCWWQWRWLTLQCGRTNMLTASYIICCSVMTLLAACKSFIYHFIFGRVFKIFHHTLLVWRGFECSFFWDTYYAHAFYTGAVHP